MDTAELLHRIVGAQFIDSAGVQLGVAFPRASGRPEVWVAGSGAASAQTRVAELVQASLRSGAAPPGTTLRLHLRVTPSVALSLERSILCGPTPLDSVSAGQPGFQLTEGAGKGPPQRWKAVVRQRIGTDGRVLEAHLNPSSGRLEVDRVALEPVYARRWRPATLDGRPVVVWFSNGKATLAK